MTDSFLLEESETDQVEDTNSSSAINNDSIMDLDESLAEPRLLSTGFYIFDCTDPQCIKQFRRYSNLENHLLTGKHIYKSTKIPLVDRAKLLYKQLIENDTSRIPITLNQLNSTFPTDELLLTNQLMQGWALPRKKPPTRYSNDVVSFLTAAFDEGVSTSKKWDPAALSQVR